ncbi:putative PKS/NRPS-like protein biosynthetic cluster [Aspergillus brasiliensis]|nr:putative PKS/NRPS-like protein biosynthetic cluster [Aspergillus brasiliensis]
MAPKFFPTRLAYSAPTDAMCAALSLSPPVSEASSPARSLTVDLIFDITGSKLVLPIPVRHLQSIRSYKSAFISQLSSIADGDVLREPPLLCLAFIEFLLAQEGFSRYSLAAVLRAFEAEFLHGHNEIHCLIAGLATVARERQRWLRVYYDAVEASGELIPATSRSSFRSSALFDHVHDGGFHLMAIFGGQGEASRTCVQELADLYAAYRPLIRSFIEHSATFLSELSRLPDSWFCRRGQSLDLMTWISDTSAVPEGEYIAQAPISVPVIGLLSLARYMVTCRVLHMDPGQLRAMLSATTGHSQGLLVSTIIAMSDSWDTFRTYTDLAVEVLFWLGQECHQCAPNSYHRVISKTDPSWTHATPSYMLSVRGVSREQLGSILDRLNSTLPPTEEIHIALANGRDHFVVAGPIASLVHMDSQLNSIKRCETDNSQVPFGSRKLAIQHAFLSISTPFHTQYLAKAAKALKHRFSGQYIKKNQLKIPVYHTSTGKDLRKGSENILHAVFDAIARESCDWPTALTGPSRTDEMSPSHIIVFDRGGLGPMVHRLVEGTGIRVIQGADLDSRDPDIGTMRDLFSSRLLESSTRPLSWAQQFQPRLIAGCLETRISSLLSTPPVVVGGMTPTTVRWDFVSAIMNAGYHAELAGGGYRNSSDMATAISNLVAHIPPGRGITCNVIYANPQAMHWQIALLRRLSHNRVPIDGITIGAGVPSLEVASEYIRTLGLRHISFKPGSVSTIRRVVDIARAHPEFPIILQWTGGRGGGHHSFEDFHAPILSTYGTIRQQSNIYLVAGSGFGDSDSIYPYITGQWSLPLGYPCMPFDGVLLGSRMMVAQEAHTSSAVKGIILKTPGVPDCEWEKTYSGPAGGIITVQSEMGEPIHKIATRGVRLWADMDRTVFSLPRKDRVAYLQKHHNSIIQRLNTEFAKPWFGRNSFGDIVGLNDMTYNEVLSRMVELMYVNHQNRWIDPSYVDFTMAMASRAFERLLRVESHDPDLTQSALSEAPMQFLDAFTAACPTASEEIMNPEDASFFLMRSKMPGQKPVNFIPALNDDFEFYFKKDSLWQAEDIDAVVDQDAERVCILQGPVAVQYSVRRDQPAKEILDDITNGLIELMQHDASTESSSPTAGSGLVTPESWSSVSGAKDIAMEELVLSSTAASETTDDRSLSGGVTNDTSRNWPAWLRAIFEGQIVSRNRRRKRNPFQQFIALYPDTKIRYDARHSEACVTVQDACGATSLMKVSSLDGIEIRVDLYPPQISDPLQLVYQFDPRGTPFSLTEITPKRISRVRCFYSKLWLQEKTETSIQQTYHGRELILTRELLDDLIAAVGPAFPDSRLLEMKSDFLPISAGIIVAWDVITKPLLNGEIDGDLLHLVHRANAFEYCANASTLRVGDRVNCQSRVQAVYVEDAGKVVVVEAQIIRSGKEVMTITSTFLYRTSFRADSTFRRSRSGWAVHLDSNLEETVLRRRPWFHLHDTATSLARKDLIFSLETQEVDKENGFKRLHVTGTACLQDRDSPGPEVGTVDFDCAYCVGNPVLDFFERKGGPLSKETTLQKPGWSGPSSIDIQMPVSNQAYAEVSTDFNPVHVSTIFASLADLPGTVCHGMATSAISVAALEHLALGGDRSRLRQFTAKFTGMVMPLERLIVQIQHTGMIDGRMRLTVDVVRKDSQEKVLEAEAIVDQPATAYLFTGQGSQGKGMGMDLYQSSPVARSVWDEIDAQLFSSYGWSVLDIVKNNPKSITVHFGGKQGRKIRQNYLAITTETVLADGSHVETPVLQGLSSCSTSYTFTDSRGLLYSTQFAQPAILLFEAAAVADLRSRGYLSPDAVYAGHSLGEFGALSALSASIPMGALAELAFYRGLMMQASVAGSNGNAYGMVAVNPKRVGPLFDEEGLSRLVGAIALASQELLEVVNYNIQGEQYVCSGTVVNLWVLGRLLDYIAQSDGPDLGMEYDSVITELLSDVRALSPPIQLQRGRATIPLEGIDVPFHSSHLRSTVDRFRQCLLRPGFLEGNVDLEALRRYIPNVMARPFSVDEEYIREAYERTHSPVLGEILGLGCK